MSATTQKKPTASNGSDPSVDPLAEALAYEQAIANKAADIRDDAVYLTDELFLKLWPLLRKPIPAGFIVSTEATRGKPYDSTGIKSLQVQIDRMDNVLTPLNWEWQTEWSGEGRIADVTVRVFASGERDNALVTRRARGGVNQASTDGNLQKGSETNAAKLALARIGVGHEVYLGVTDHDPDVDPDAAKANAEGASGEPATRKLPAEKVETLKAVISEAGLDGFLEMKLRSFGVDSLEALNVEQGIAVWEWVQQERAGG